MENFWLVSLQGDRQLLIQIIQFLKQKEDTLWDERHTASPQDTGEMFAAQDPGMMEQPFTDPGMEFDPADDAYIMDEEFA